MDFPPVRSPAAPPCHRAALFHRRKGDADRGRATSLLRGWPSGGLTALSGWEVGGCLWPDRAILNASGQTNDVPKCVIGATTYAQLVRLERTRESLVSTYATAAPALFAADVSADADDEHLAQRADARSYGLLYERHLPAVYRYVAGKVALPEVAEDLTSEAFRQAWSCRRAYRGRGTFRAWLFSIVRRSVADHYRHHRPAATLEAAVVDRLRDSAPGPEDEALREDQSRTTRELLAGLSEEQREVLSLRFAAELTYAEIGTVIGKRDEAVKKIAQRALEAIRGRQTHAESN